jgi:hypothetical protein
MTAGVRRCRSRPRCATGLQGRPVRRSRVPQPCRVMTPGGAEPAAVAEPAGQENRVGGALSVTAPIPAVRDQAFSCPWLSGSRGARTCSGRRRPQACLAARIRWSAAFDSGRRRAVCKTVGSAYVGSNPTPATTCGNGPLVAETRPRGCFRSCHVAYQSVSLCVEVSRCPRTYSGRVRAGCAVGDTVGFPRTPRTAPAKGALSLPRCGAGAMRRPTAGIARDGRARRRQKDERCGRPWLLLPGARAGSSCTGEGARPGRLSLNVIHPGRPGGPDPSRTPNRALALAPAVPGSGGSRTSCSGWAFGVQHYPDPGARLAGGVVAQVGRVSLRVVCTGAGTCQISAAGCCGGHHVAAAVILLTVLEAGELPAGTAP